MVRGVTTGGGGGGVRRKSGGGGGVGGGVDTNTATSIPNSILFRNDRVFNWRGSLYLR